MVTFPRKVASTYEHYSLVEISGQKMIVVKWVIENAFFLSISKFRLISIDKCVCLL